MSAPEIGNWPIWLVVALCGVFTQSIKLILYSVTRKKVALPLLAQGNGLPSLPATLFGCLLVLVIFREGWQSAEAAFALVFAVIGVHDTVKLSGMAERQREVLVTLLREADRPGDLRRGVAEVLDPRAHHPAHVVAGLVLGVLFALAFVSARH